MSTPENGGLDPFAAALAELRARRDQIDQAIRTIEALGPLAMQPSRGAAVDAGPATTPTAPQNETPATRPGDFLGMSIADAAKKLLASQRRAMSNPEIANALIAGGLVMNSAEPANTVGSVVTRRFAQIGDIVKVGRGVWGLKEWYPNRSFKPTSPKEIGASADPIGPPPLSEQIVDDPLMEAVARERGLL